MFAKRPHPTPKQPARSPVARLGGFRLFSSTELHLRPQTFVRGHYRGSGSRFLIVFEELSEAIYAELFFGNRKHCSDQVRGACDLSETQKVRNGGFVFLLDHPFSFWAWIF